MMEARPFMLYRLEALPAAPPYLVDERDVDGLIGDAERLGLDTVVLDGSLIDTEGELLREVGRLLDFPSYFGGSWDAFNDSVGDLPHLRERGLALFWRRADILLRRDPVAFLTSMYRLQRASEDLAGDADRPFELGVIFSGEWSFSSGSET